MNIGISLPVAVEGVDGPTLIEWARRSERYPFTALSVLDRIVYPNYEAFMTLAAAAAVTTRVRLITAVLLAPLRTNTALLAKQAVTLDNLSGGRLVLGMAVGSRQDDYAASDADFHRRGRAFDRQLDEMLAIWRGEGGIGPRPIREGGPELMIGGHVEASIRRVVRLGCGWVQGGGGPEQFKHAVDEITTAWRAGGRSGKPHLQAGVRFAFGDNAREYVVRDAGNYYGSRDPSRVDRMAAEAAMDADSARRAVAAFEELGADEVVFSPSSPDPAQIDMLAKALF